MSVNADTASDPSRAVGPNEPEQRPGFRAWRIHLLMMSVVLGVFAPICRHAFIAWDDDYTIEQNPLIQHPSIEHVLHYWRHGFMDLYIPVTYTLWSGLALVSRGLSGGESPLMPGVFHAASVLIHALNVLLVFALLRRLLNAPWPAAGGAMLFAMHPVQVEAIAWASGFKDLLCAMFSLIALNQYLRAVEPSVSLGPVDEQQTRRRHAIALGALLLGMLSKPTAMVTPVMAVALDAFVIGRPWRRVARSVWPYFLLAGPCLVWTKLCQPAGYLRHVPLWRRPLVAGDAVAFYVLKLIAPIHLTYDYGRAPWVIFEKRWVYFSWIVPAAIVTALIVHRRRVRPLVAGALILVAGVVPVLGFSTFDFEMVSTVADHYLYLAMLGPALAVAWALTRCPATARWPALAAGGALAVFAACSANQERYWRDTRAVFTHAIAVNPRSWSSWYGLGYVVHMEGRQLATLAADANPRSSDAVDAREAANDLLEQAMNCYRQTVYLNPSQVGAHHGYGAMLMYFGNYRDAAREFSEVVRRRDLMTPAIRPQYYADTDLLGRCLLASGRSELAIRAFTDAMKLQPPPADAAAHLKQAQTALANSVSHPMPTVTGTGDETSRPAIGDD